MKHILVFTDFSDVCFRAFTQALTIAEMKEAKVSLCHIRSEESGDTNEVEEEMNRYSDKAREAGVPFEGSVCTGDLYEEAAATARRLNPDLVVTGTHGSAGIGLKTLGSAIHKLVRTLPVPSLIMGEKGKVQPDGYEKVLVPAGDQPSYLPGIKKVTELMAEAGKVVLFSIVSNQKPLSPEATRNRDEAKRILDERGIAWSSEEATAAPHATGFAPQTLEFMREQNMELIVIPAEVSKRNRHFGKLDKEAVLLNEDGFHVLCINS